MRVACPTCHAEYMIDERRVPPGGLNVRCPKCQGTFPVRPPQGSGVPLPAPEAAPAGATQRFAAPEAAPSGATQRFAAPEAAPARPAIPLPSPVAPWPPPPPPHEAITVELPSPFAPPTEPSEPPPTAAMTARFSSPFAAPPAHEEETQTDGPFAQPTFPSLPPPLPQRDAPLGFGEVDFGDDRPPVLGHADEPFPFEMPQAKSEVASSSIAGADAAPVELDEGPVTPVPAQAALEPPGESAVHASEHEAVPLPRDPFARPPGGLAEPSGRDDPFATAMPGAPEEHPFPEAEYPPPVLGTDAGSTEQPDAHEPESMGGLGALGAKEAEELEMLFDEGAVKERAPAPPAQAAPPHATLFKVRRRSGKIFGPFTEAEVVQMLGKGELLGNEDVSADDGASFGTIGAVPAFGEAMRRLMETPGAVSAPRLAGSAGRAPEEKAARKATVASRTTPARLVEVARKLAAAPRLKLLVAGVVLVLLLAAGLGAGLTPYGVFFYRLALGQTGAHRPGAKLLAQARGQLAEDGFAGVKGALDLADRALRIQPSDREAKALYGYAASLLARRHGGGAEAWARAKAFLPELSTRIEEDPDAAKAVLSGSLVPADRAADAAASSALNALQRQLAKSPRDEDALLVLGDVALARPDLGQAAALYARLDAVRPGTARGKHALGVVAERRGEAAAAQQLFEAALERDPRHLASAVELAQLALASGEVARAEQYARRVLAPEAQGQAGPAERARARTILGQAAVRTPGGELEERLAAAEKELEAATREDPENLEARLALAAFELDRNAPDKASAALAPVLAAAAREPRLADVQARALAGQGRVLDALTLLDGALERSPGDARLLFAKGLVVYQGGKHAEGEKLWADAQARAPRAWEPHLALGQARLARGELGEAEKELKLAAERAPAEGAVLSGMADLLLARRDLAGAEQAYQRALAIAPAHAGAYFGLSRVALARGDEAAAQAALDRALRLDPRLAPAQAARGQLLWKARDLAGAKKALQAAVALDPRDGVARGRLGAVELEAGETDAALTDLLTASNLEMGSAEIRGWYARALVSKGEVAQAIEQLHKSVELDPRSARYQIQLGQALERTGSLQEAVEAYRAAQALAPELVEAYETLAALYAGQNRCADALPQLDKAIALAPKEQRLRVASADCKVRLGKHAEAVALYRRALQADPAQVGLYYKIARAQHEAGGRKGALPWYERAAREEPRNPMPHYYLGFAYKEGGQRSKAIEAFRAYLSAKPDAEDKKDIEREIEDLGGKP